MQKVKKLARSLTYKRKHKGGESECGEVFAYVLPPLVRNALAYLNSRSTNIEGIFRVTGSIADIERIAKRYAKGKEEPLEQIANPHTVAGLLKHYIRHKPGGIVPACTRSCFLAAGDVEDEALRILCISKALKLLPMSNLYIITKICEYLYEVQKYERENKMSAYNLSLIFGNAFFPSSTDNIDVAFAQGSQAYVLTETMIRHYHKIFEKEEELLDFGVDVPVKIKAFLDLFESSSPIPPHKQKLSNEGPPNTMPTQLLSRHRNASVGFQSLKKSWTNNKHLEEAMCKQMCDKADVELLAEYLSLGETELFSSYLNRIAPDSCAKDKIRKAAIKMYRNNKPKRKTASE